MFDGQTLTFCKMTLNMLGNIFLSVSTDNLAYQKALKENSKFSFKDF